MTIDINELRRLAQAATPGHWQFWHGWVAADIDNDGGVIIVERPTPSGGKYQARVDSNFKFIAAANPAAISELLDRLEAAEKAVTEAYQRGYETGQEEVEKERDALRAMLEDERKEHSYTLRAAKAEAKQVDALRTKIEEVGRLITWVKDECRLYPDSLDEKAFADRLLAAITHPKSGLQSAQPKTSLSSGLHPLETVHFWADVYTHPGDDTFRGHGMAAALLREYAELRAALVAEAKP